MSAGAIPVLRALPAPLARAHGWARAQPWLCRFTWMTRILLAVAFLPTGFVKLSGQRFTLLPVSDPVGFFFEAMYRTGPYWLFIGLVQVVAAVLVVVPRTSLVGALLFLPVTLSIVLITWGVGFTGTVGVVTMMLIAVVYLLCWDGDRLWPALALVCSPLPCSPLIRRAHPLELIGWALGGGVGAGLFLVVRGILPRTFTPLLLVAGAVAAAVVVTGWIVAAARLRPTPKPRVGSTAGRQK